MPKFSKSYFLWLITMTFFAYQFILRNTPGLMFDEIISKFNISASEFALFSSSFYLTYAIMQIPTGIILDKYNIRYSIPILVLLFVFGSFLFISSDNLYLAILGRVLMGIGATAGFLGGAKVISMVFPKSLYSIMISLTFTLGFLGAVYGGKPMRLLIENYGSYTTFMYFIIGGVLIAVLGLFFLSSKKQYELETFKKSNLITHLKNKDILLTSIFGGFMVGSTEGFADTWGYKFISNKYNLNMADASFVVSMVYIGLCFGGPILVWFSDKISNNYRTTIISGIIMGLLFMALVSNISLQMWQLITITTIIGIFTGSQVLIFSITNSFCENRYAGITSAITNSIVMSFGFIIHQIIGLILDIAQNSDLNSGLIINNIGFDVAMGVIALFMFIGSVGIGFMARGHKKRLYYTNMY